MKTIIKTTFLLLAVVALSTVSCKKKKATPAPISTPAPAPINSRIIKYTITGNYSGQLNVAYSNASGATESLLITSVPWSKDITYASTVGGIGFGGGSEPSALGSSAQSVTVTIYSSGTAVQTGTATTNVNGVINLPTLAFVFP